MDNIAKAMYRDSQCHNYIKASKQAFIEVVAKMAK